MQARTLLQRVVVAGALALVPGWVGAASTAQEGEPPASIRFGCSVFGVPNGVVCELMRRDRILRDGLTILTGLPQQHQDFDVTPPIMKLIAEGQMDITSAADLPVLESAARRHIRVIGLIRVGHVIVVGPKGKEMADLKGKRIGYAPGTSSHYGILQALESAGMSERDVQLVALPADKIAPALFNQQIEAFSLHEPVPSGVIAKYPERYAAIHRNLSFAYQVVARSFAERHPEAVPLIAAALARAVRFMRKDRQNLALAAHWMHTAAKNLKGSEPDFSEAEVIRLTRDTLLDIREAPLLPGNSTAPNSPLAREVEFMRQQGRMPEGVIWSTISTAFDFSQMTTVLGNAKKFRIDEFDYAH